MSRAITGTWIALSLVGLFVAGCGEDKKVPTAPECTANGIECTTDDECCAGNCDDMMGVCARLIGVCAGAGAPCGTGPDCCSFSCTDFTCSDNQCTSDNESCDADGECCSGTCTDGSCTPPNPNCETSGNECTDSSECCSKFCNNGLCDAAPSFCTQVGDICLNDFECCGGHCAIVDGNTVGVCELAPASGAGGCLSAGEVCGGEYDGGELPVCGGECCSRACLPYGPSGVLVCQPPSGCHPTGETCQNDEDCCGGPGNPDNGISDVLCSKVDGNPIGRCDAGNACTPAGGICRLQSQSCNENANCCSGNVLQFNTCALDNLGIPRCLAAEIDCTDPSDYEGLDCATSADCCGLPCTPSGSGEFPTLTCGGEVCVNSGGVCTTAADCCSGLPCILPPGSTQGTCGDVPGDCYEVGQICEMDADCCNNVPCTNGICGFIVE